MVKKGAEEAGAIHIAVLARDGAIRFYRPAPQTSYDQERAGQRKFQLDPVVTDQQALRTFTEKEERFDPDFWVVELELGNADELPFDVTTP